MISRRALIGGAGAAFAGKAARGQIAGPYVAPPTLPWRSDRVKLGVYCGYGRTNANNIASMQSLLRRTIPLGVGFLGYDDATTLKVTVGNAITGSGGAVGGYAALGVANVSLAVPLAVTGVSLDQVTAGALDTVYNDNTGIGGINGICQQLAALGYTAPYIRLGHEFNVGIGLWPWYCDDTTGRNAASYNAAFRHVVLNDIRPALPGAKIVWNPAAGKNNVANVEDYYPGDDVVDVIGVDQYNYGGLDIDKTDPIARWMNETYGCLGTATVGTQYPFRLQWAIAFAKAHGKQFAIPEMGTGFLPGNAPWNMGDDGSVYMTNILGLANNPANNCAFIGMGDVIWGSPANYNTRISFFTSDPGDYKPNCRTAMITAFS